jgi:hypothetical protein
VRRQALDGERPGDADDVLVLQRLVKERLRLGVTVDGSVDFLTCHPRLDVGVVGDALERDVRHTAIDKALADVAFGRTADWRDA